MNKKIVSASITTKPRPINKGGMFDPMPKVMVKIEGENTDSNDFNLWVTGRTLEEAQKKAAEKKAHEDLYIKPVIVAWASTPNVPAYGYALDMGH